MTDELQLYPVKSLRDVAKDLGLSTYDTALPQNWVDHIVYCFGKDGYPVGHIVWCYDGSLIGYPVALDEKGRQLIGVMAANHK